MKKQMRLVGCVVILGSLFGGDLLACGDKFLVAGRGTRYERPRNARAASILIYANPASGLPMSLGDQQRLETALKREGHRSTTVQSFDQLSATLRGGRFDIILSSSSDAAEVEKLLGAAPDRAIVVGLESTMKQGSLLKAIDKAVERRDQNVRKAQVKS